jgi:O-methyltransferase
MRRVILGILKRLVYWLSVPVILADYFAPQTGAEYSISFFTKCNLAIRMGRNYRRITTGSRVIEHLIMATQIMRVSKGVEGCIVECGSFKGGSATNLSLVAALCGRKMEIFDSFAGLPEPSEIDKEHRIVSIHQVHTYEKGAWRGTLDEVKGNISAYGRIDVCNFNVGYFSETMPTFHKRAVFAFLDVDLRDSLESCLLHLWPQLQDGSYVFTHEAPHMEIASVFFCENWWSSTAGCTAPGLVGAGTGLGLLPSAGGFRSDLGYTVKTPAASEFILNPQTGIL